MRSHQNRGLGYVATGYQMIQNIDVRNFRCFEHLKQPCSRVNVIVGDNGAGKTALLEAIFFPLNFGPAIGVRLRQARGLEGSFAGSHKAIEEAIYADFFRNRDTFTPISVTLNGDGVDNRSVEVARGGGGETLLDAKDGAIQTIFAPISFTIRDHMGRVFPALTPSISQQGVTFPDTGEQLDTGFFFASNQTIPASENAARFSDLSKRSRHHDFVKTFLKEYDWISDIAVEVFAGSPVLFATVVDSDEKIPVPNISSGINRVIGMTLAMASTPKTPVLIDEIENGIYYKHMPSVWRQVLSFAREFDCQLFITTHSRECLKALVASSKDLSDVSLWQLSRDGRDHQVDQVTGEQMRAALEYDEEVR